jgi:alpha-tubulin suppressor-like RCC1 family protein
VVVGVEGEASFPVYASRGVTVTPRAGQRMLRLGTPRPKSGQHKGVTTVSQTFTPTATSMRIAVRVFSWEYRAEDSVVIDLKNAAGQHVGSCERPRSDKHSRDKRSGLPFVVTMTDGTVRSHGKMPIEIAPRSALRNALMDTGWLVVDVTDLPIGTPLTLSYSLRKPKDASHPTWVYFDDVNNPPTVEDMSFRTDKNRPLSVPAAGVLVGAVDPDGDALEASLVTPPEHGLLTLRADGAFSYAPDYGFTGSDVFAFKASDGQSESGAATATITVDLVNDAPRPAEADVETDEDTSVHVTLPPANANGDGLTYSIVGPPANGQLAADSAGDGNLEYSPNPHFSGWDSFTYYASDGLLYWDVGTVWIEVKLVNHAPVADELVATTNEGTPVGLTLSASDREGDPFTFEIVSAPASGTLSAIAGDGSVNYTPDESFYGVDTFTYRAIDTTPGATVTATITVDPLVAMFDYAPTDPREGESLGVFGDLSHSADPAHSIVAWNWSVAGPNGFADSFDGELSYFVPPVEGSYDVTLTVTDTRGATATKHVAIPVLNDPPRVKALDLEVLPGRTATVTGRFLDAGWTDSHTAGVAAVGAGAASLSEDSLAAVSSGIVTAPITTDASGTGVLTVTDDDGGEASASFDVTVVQPGYDRSAPGFTLIDRDDPAFPKAYGNASYLSYIKSAGDVDLYEVRMPDGDPLPFGTEVLASLKGLPADFDLAILSELPSGSNVTMQQLQGAPFEQGTVDSTGGRMTLHRMSLHRMSLHRMSLGRMSLHRMSLHRMSLHRMSLHRMSLHRMSLGRYDAVDALTWPLSDMSFTGLEDPNLDGTDIPLAELGFQTPAGSDMRVASFSANRGLRDETALARTETAGNRIYIAVLGANGAFHPTEPYTLQVETAEPADTSALADAVVHSALVPADQSTAVPAVLGPNVPADQKLTLFVTQAERFEALYGADAWTSILGKLETMAARADVMGEILSVPSAIYDEWDEDPYSVERANAVTDQVLIEIQKRLQATPSIRYVVFVGDDGIVPFRRIQDDTVIGNESYYADESFVRTDSPLYASMSQKFFLSDDFYADARPVSWQGRSLAVPDVATSRLIETPAEISHTIDTFIEMDGQLVASSGFSSGYDFFTDGSTAVADTMKSALLDVDSLLSGTWSAGQLRERLFQPTTESTSAPDIVSANAHFTQYLALSAVGLAAGDITDALTSVEMSIPVAPRASMEGRVIYTIGCHAGFSVPDTDAVPVDPSLGIDTALDFPQAMARQGAVYVGNTGFGLGDSDGVALSELLTQMFTEDLLQNGGATVGDALRSAKQRYLLSAVGLTPYDEKASGEFTVFGLPQYRIRTNSGPLASSFLSGGLWASAGLPTWVGTDKSVVEAGTFALTVTDGGTGTKSSHALQRVTCPSGTFIAAEGNTQVSDSRPVQPKIALTLEKTPAGAVHGIMLGNGAYADTDLFDPVFGTTVTGWDSDVPENEVSREGFWPASPAVLKSLETTQLLQTLVVVPGQFRAASSADATVTGVQRTWSSLDVSLLRSNSSHWGPPVVGAVRLYATSPTTITVSFAATDAAGIGTIAVSRLTAVGIASTTVEHPTPVAGRYFVPVNVADYSALLQDLSFVVQVADGDGNVAISTGKGATMHLVDASIVDAPTEYTPGEPVGFVGRVADFASLVPPVSYTWDFGDGETVSGSLTSTYPLDGGDADVSVAHAYAGARTRTVRFTVSDAAGGMASIETTIVGQSTLTTDTTPPLVSITSPLDGAIETSTVDVVVDAVDLAAESTGTAPSDESVSGMSRVDFYLDDLFITTDDEPPYEQSINVSSTPDGAHVIKAVGFDNAGNPATSTVSITKVTPSPWRAISSGDSHTAAVRGDGTMWAWGANWYGQIGDGTTATRTVPVRVDDRSDWSSVSTGDYHTAAVRSDGTVWAWGANWYGQIGDGTLAHRHAPVQVGAGTADWASVQAGAYHTLAIKRDGTLWAWGLNQYGQLGDGTTATRDAPVQVGDDTDWSSVSADGYHTLAVKKDGTMWAWGFNGQGQIGDGTNVDRNTPVQVGMGTADWASVAAGNYYSTAVRRDGALWAWGQNDVGQLGDGTSAARNAPVQVGSRSDWVSVAAGQSHTVAARRDGTLWAWGNNPCGELGDGSNAPRYSPVQVVARTEWSHVSAGHYFTVAVGRNGSLWAWGRNQVGQLGDGTGTDRNAPDPIGAGWRSVSGGNGHTVALRWDGTLWAWGSNYNGQLGDGITVGRSLLPVSVGPYADWESVSAGGDHTVGIRRDGTLWAWGANYRGQLGAGTTTDSPTPLRIGPYSDWESVSAGIYYTVGIRRDGTLWAWGYNPNGQLGDGTRISSNSPSQVGTSTAWLAVSAGGVHTVAVRHDGTLWAWGDSSQLQLGGGYALPFSLTPVRIGPDADWSSASAGSVHTVAVKRDGTLWAWGNNNDGQLGDAAAPASAVPLHVGPDSDWASAFASWNHTAALKRDGTLWAWGNNAYGQIGDGTLVARSVPTIVPGSADWALVADGSGATFGIRRDGSLWAWGANSQGKLGDGTMENRLVPTLVPR